MTTTSQKEQKHKQKVAAFRAAIAVFITIAFALLYIAIALLYFSTRIEHGALALMLWALSLGSIYTASLVIHERNSYLEKANSDK